MKNSRVVLLIGVGMALELATSPLAGQDNLLNELALEISETITGEDGDYESSVFFIEEYIKLANAPLNINSACREELERVFFLSDEQIESLLFRRYQVGHFISIYDLQLIEGFCRQLIEWLEPVIVFDTPQTRCEGNLRSRGNAFTRARFTLETPRGYHANESGEVPFQGDKMNYYKRVELDIANEVGIGLVAEKDAGEPMFNRQIPIFDLTTGYITWKPGRFVRELILGQYHFGAGQGLAIQTGMRARKSAMTTSIRNRFASHRPSLSASGGAAFNGALVSMGGNNFTITPFLSTRKRSGRLTVNDTGETVLTSLKTDGNYRTLTELEQRRVTREDIIGIRGKFYAGNFIFEAGHLEYRLEHPFMESSDLHDIFSFRGDAARNSWFAAQVTFLNVHLFSEVALSPFSTPATWVGGQFSPGGMVDMAIAFRDIPREYVAPLGNPLTAASRFAGERGIYAGLTMNLPGGFVLNAYIDRYQHEWLRHQVYAPAWGHDFLGLLEYNRGGVIETALRYRFREQMENLPGLSPSIPVLPTKLYQLRLQFRYRPTRDWVFTTRMDYNFTCTTKLGSVSPGFYIAQDLRYNSPDSRWSIVTRYALMDVEDYATRVYAHEPDVLYSMSIPAYSGTGTRWIVMGKLEVIPGIDLWLRYARWYFNDRQQTGTANMIINSNVKQDCTIQIRARF